MNLFIYWIILYSVPQYWLCWFGINILWIATTAKIISLVVYWNIKFADMMLFEGNTNRVHFSHNIQRQSFLTWIVIIFYCWLWFIIASMVRLWNTRWSFRNLEVIVFYDFVIRIYEYYIFGRTNIIITNIIVYALKALFYHHNQMQGRNL